MLQWCTWRGDGSLASQMKKKGWSFLLVPKQKKTKKNAVRLCVDLQCLASSIKFTKRIRFGEYFSFFLSFYLFIYLFYLFQKSLYYLQKLFFGSNKTGDVYTDKTLFNHTTEMGSTEELSFWISLLQTVITHLIAMSTFYIRQLRGLRRGQFIFKYRPLQNPTGHNDRFVSMSSSSRGSSPLSRHTRCLLFSLCLMKDPSCNPFQWIPASFWVVHSRSWTVLDTGTFLLWGTSSSQ